MVCSSSFCANPVRYGNGVLTVAAGKGSAIIQVTPRNNPPKKAGYTLQFWSVGAGKSSASNAWQQAVAIDSKKTTTCADSVKYPPY